MGQTEQEYQELAAPLGEQREVELDAGTIRYRERGSGPTIVFVQGFLASGLLWRKVVPLLAGHARCITADWPTGSHRVPMREDAALDPPGLARIVADLLAALDLRDVTLVGNDSGGAICQLVVTRHPERVGALVLTPCDAYDNFPPALFNYVDWAARVPGALRALTQTMRLPLSRNLPIAYGWLARHGIPREVTRAYVQPGLDDPAIGRDAAKMARGLDKRHTQEAAGKLREFGGPVLLAWPPDNRFFPFEHARRLSEDFANARVEPVEDSYTFVSEDQPERLAALIGDFVRERTAAPGAAAGG